MSKNQITRSHATRLNQACLADKVRLINRSITGIYDDALKPIGITTSQMNVLVVVAKYGEAAPRQVSEWLYLEKSTLSRNVKRMEKSGWLTSIPAGGGRSHLLRVTAKGAAVLDEGLPLWEVAQKKARKLLGSSGAKEVMRIADSMRAL